MECKMCGFTCTKQSKLDIHNNSEKHKSLKFYTKKKINNERCDFKKKLEEANQEKEKTRLENLSLKRKLKEFTNIDISNNQSSLNIENISDVQKKDDKSHSSNVSLLNWEINRSITCNKLRFRFRKRLMP